MAATSSGAPESRRVRARPAGLEVADPAERDHAGSLLGIGEAGQQLGPHRQLDVVPDHDRPSRSIVEPAAQR